MGEEGEWEYSIDREGRRSVERLKERLGKEGKQKRGKGKYRKKYEKKKIEYERYEK